MLIPPSPCRCSVMMVLPLIVDPSAPKTTIAPSVVSTIVLPPTNKFRQASEIPSAF